MRAFRIAPFSASGFLPARDTAVETAVHFIRHSIYPEGEDIGNQLLLHLLFHLLDIHKFLSYEL